MIGHLGICDSAGIIYDFGGPYYIAEDRCGGSTWWQCGSSLWPRFLRCATRRVHARVCACVRACVCVASGGGVC